MRPDDRDPPKKPAAADREARLAAALRANLKRRKDVSKAARPADSEAEDSEGPDPGEDGKPPVARP